MRFLRHAALLPPLCLLGVLLYLFGPFVAGWLEVVAPPIARILAVPAAQPALKIALGLVVVAYIGYLASMLRSRHGGREKTWAYLPLLAVPLIVAAMILPGRSFHDRQRESAYVAGGWTRMMLAGGPAAIRAEALDLLASPEGDALHTTIPAADTPASLRRLGDSVSVQRDYGLVLVGIKPVAKGANGFGYMIHAGRTPLSIPWFFQFASNLRVWKIAEGVYFFEE